MRLTFCLPVIVCVADCCGVFVCRQRGLFRVLKAYTQHKPEEGYCQAQGPVAAVLLMNMPAEVTVNNTHSIPLCPKKLYMHLKKHSRNCF